MSIEGLEYDTSALRALAEADDYALVTITRDSEGNPDSEVFASSMIPIPFCVAVLREYFRKEGMDYDPDDADDEW